MHFTKRVVTLVQSAIKSYGPSHVKQIMWDSEYSTDKWDFADHTANDCLYGHLEAHAANGSILDLGCGSGNTANELALTAYSRYVGADISEVCLNKARERSQANGRADKNHFVLGDFINYVPTETFDVILFRESMYHIPMGQIRPTLERYANYLNESGVFIVRMKTSLDGQVKRRPTSMIELIERDFDVVEKRQYEKGREGSTVIVFRLSQQASKRI
jgi:SAM-dependent methyltransferase